MTDEIDRTFNWWTDALKGVRGQIDGDNPRAGFYCSQRKDRRTKEVTRQPVAYWYDSNDGELRCHRSGRDVPELEAREMWPFVSQRPITEQTYHDVLAGKPWPDIAATAGTVAVDENLSPDEALAEEIEAAKAGMPQFAKIESDEQASLAQSLRSRLTELKGKAEKEYEAANRPLLDQQKALRTKWFPLKEDAEAAAVTIRRAQEAWETFKRERAREEQRKADEIARANAEAIRKAEEAGKPAPALTPPPVQSNAPAPSAQIKGGQGRAASVSVYQHVVSIDEDKVFAQFKGNADLTALLINLAQKAIKAGVPVPGAVTEERTAVR